MSKPAADRDEIEAKAEEFGIHTSNVQRDYVIGCLISGLYQTSPLVNTLVLKGGALRKAYFPLTRFSDDLDFTTPSAVDADSLIARFNDRCRFAEARSGVRFDLDRNAIAGERVIYRDKRVYKRHEALTGADAETAG